MMLRMSRKEAMASGLTKYWPLKPCNRGHDSMRRSKGPCIECERIGRRAWKVANPEIAARSSASAWAKRNPERHRANSAKWSKANGWYSTQAVNERRARKRGAEGAYSRLDIDGLRQAQRNRCAHCYETGQLEVDHIVPLARGGTNWPSNLQLLCRSCNARKGTRIEGRRNPRVDPDGNPASPV